MKVFFYQAECGDAARINFIDPEGISRSILIDSGYERTFKHVLKEEIIKLKGLKTREVAHDADLDVENLRKYIKGKQEMKVSTMLKIAKSLGVSVSDLFDFSTII